MPLIKCLHYFTSTDISLLEIQRTDHSESASPSSIYKWLVLSPKSGLVLELDFKLMGERERDEFRIFVEGEFRFNAKEGHLSLLGKNYQLERQGKEKVSIEILEIVKSYLCEPIDHNIPVSFRALKPSDVNSFKEWILDREVIRYSMTKFHRISHEAQIVEWFHGTLFDSKTFQLGLVDPISKILVGYAGISSLNEVDSNGEYFILIGDKSYWGKGIATSVTKEIVKIGFRNLKLHRIFLTASSRNPGAIRAYEKAGFVHEGRMREAFCRYDEISDKIVMGILKSEFEGQ